MPDSKDTTEAPLRRQRRLAVLLLIGLTLIGATLFVYRFWMLRPIGEGPAGPAVPVEVFRTTWSERPVLLLGMGDSITAGYGAAADKGFFARLAANPQDEFAEMGGVSLKAVLPNLDVVNVSVSGSDSIQHVEKQLTSLKPFGQEVFGIVVLTTGGNDLIHWYGARPPKDGAMYGADLSQAGPWIESFERRLAVLLDGVTALFPGGCRIFLGNIYDPSDGGGDSRWIGLPPWPDAQQILARYNDIIRDAAKARDNVHWVDIHGGFLGHGIRCSQFWRSTYRPEDPHYWFFQNIEDPNERGHDALRRIFLNTMHPVLPEVLRAQQQAAG